MAVGVQVPPSAPFKKCHLRFVGVPERIFSSCTGCLSETKSVMAITKMTCIIGPPVPLRKDRPLINALSLMHLS